MPPKSPKPGRNTLDIEKVFIIQAVKEPHLLWENKEYARLYKIASIPKSEPEKMREKILHIARVNREEKVLIWLEKHLTPGLTVEEIDKVATKLGIQLYW